MPKDPSEDAIFDTRKAVADGSLTLIDTPEEAVAKLPDPSCHLSGTIIFNEA
jgi:hypothetical protein